MARVIAQVVAVSKDEYVAPPPEVVMTEPPPGAILHLEVADDLAHGYRLPSGGVK